MTDETAGLGHNQPPVDEYLRRLEGDNEALLDLESDLELARGKLPHEVNSDEDVAAITAWVTKMRLLGKNVEDARVEAKAPYLDRVRQIDGWFGKFKTRVLDAAKEIEQRSTAYLRAKAAREAAEREAERRRKAAAAAAAQEAANKAAQAAAAAAAARKAAEDAVKAAAERSPAETVAAEEQLREAVHEEQRAGTVADMADTEHRTATLAEQRAERRVDQPALGRTAGGGGAARVAMVPAFRVLSWPKLQQSLGPLNQFADIRWVETLLQRWAKHCVDHPADRKTVPGVEWFEEPETRTSASRNAPPRGHYLSERD